MMWPWTRRRPEPDPAGIKEADKRLAQADANLARAKSDWPVVMALTARLHLKIRENHLAPRFEDALREPHR